MKYFILIFMMSIGTAWSEEEAEAPKFEGTLELIMKDNPNVRAAYVECQKDQAPNADLAKCVWESKKLDQASKDKITTELTKNKNRAVFRQILETKNPLSDAIQKAMMQELMDKFTENGKPVNIDHGCFYKLYGEAIGKDVTYTASQYCLMTDFTASSKPKIHDECNDKTKGPNSSECIKYINDNLTEATNKPETVSKSWQACLKQIPAICKDNGGKDKYACIALNKFQDAREALKKLESIKKAMNTKEDVCQKAEVTEVSKNKFEIDKDVIGKNALEISSDKISADKSTENLLKEIDSKCETDALRKTNEAYCAKYYGAKDEEAKIKSLQDADLEHTITTDAELERVKKMDEEGYKKYLLEQGRTEAEIKEMSKDFNTKRDDIVRDLQETLNAKKEAIHNEVLDQLQKLKNTKAPVTESLTKKQERTKQLVRFNNIVSSYLELEISSGSSKTTQQNVAPLEVELAGKNAQNDVLKKNTSDIINSNKGNSNNGNGSLNLETINDIINDAGARIKQNSGKNGP